MFNKIEIKKISAGLNHTLLLAATGELYGCGYSTDGQLGIKHKRVPFTEIRCPLLSSAEKIVDIAAGYTFSALLTNNKNLYICGNGVKVFRKIPLIKQITTKITHIYAQEKFLYLETQKNTYSCTLQFNFNLDCIIPVPYPEYLVKYVAKKNPKTPEFQQIPNTTKITGHHQNRSGEWTEIRIGNARVVRVIKGGSHTFLICENGKIFGIGSNQNYQLGIKNKFAKTIKPVLIPNLNHDNLKNYYNT